METYEVPIDQWQPFLNRFSSAHRGDHVDVEETGAGAPPRSRLCDQPLLEMAVLARGEGSHIQVLAGDQTTPQTHTVPLAAHLIVTQRDDGFPVELCIKAIDGSVTAIRFEPESRSSNKPPEAYLG